MEERILTVGEVAQIFSVTRATIQNWSRDNTLKPDIITDRGHRKYYESTIQNFIDEHTNKKERI